MTDPPLVTSNVRTLTADACRSKLAGRNVGRVAVTQDALPIIVPVNYVLDGSHVVFRTRGDGMLAGACDGNVIAFARQSRHGEDVLVCVMNLSPVTREGYRVGLPRGGRWREAVNTDAERYGGGGIGNGGFVETEDHPWHDQPQSAPLTLPPLGVLWLVPERG